MRSLEELERVFVSELVSVLESDRVSENPCYEYPLGPKLLEEISNLKKINMTGKLENVWSNSVTYTNDLSFLASWRRDHKVLVGMYL